MVDPFHWGEPHQPLDLLKDGKSAFPGSEKAEISLNKSLKYVSRRSPPARNLAFEAGNM